MTQLNCPNCGYHVATLHAPTPRRTNKYDKPSRDAAELDKHLHLWLHDFPYGGRHSGADIAAAFNYWAEVNGLEPVGQRALTEALLRRGAQWKRTSRHRLYYFPDTVDLNLPLRQPGDPIVPRVRDSRAAQGISPKMGESDLYVALAELAVTVPNPAPESGDSP